MDSETTRIGRDRLLRVFRYLEALNEHRNPVKRHIDEQLWTLWLKELPNHSSIQRGSSLAVEVPTPVDSRDGMPTERRESDFILKIARPRLTNPPPPPALIEPWLEAGWENPFKEVSTLESRNEVASGGGARVRFGSDPKRAPALDQWKVHRTQWAQDERPAPAAMKIFEEFYELYGRVEREAERVEIVLGDGILNWGRTDRMVNSPFCPPPVEQPIVRGDGILTLVRTQGAGEHPILLDPRK